MAKFTCTFKDPDYATKGEHMKAAKAAVAIKDKFIQWDGAFGLMPYITVEFDTDKGTARVVPVD